MITYYRLWDYLNRKDINKRELCNATGLSPATITKMVNNRYVSVETIDKNGKIKNNHNSKQEKIDTQDKRKDVKKTSFLPTSAEQSSSKPLNKGFRSLKFYVNFYVFFFALRKMHVKIS